VAAQLSAQVGVEMLDAQPLSAIFRGSDQSNIIYGIWINTFGESTRLAASSNKTCCHCISFTFIRLGKWLFFQLCYCFAFHNGRLKLDTLQRLTFSVGVGFAAPRNFMTRQRLTFSFGVGFAAPTLDSSDTNLNPVKGLVVHSKQYFYAGCSSQTTCLLYTNFLTFFLP
jgi:hypothetical protein